MENTELLLEALNNRFVYQSNFSFVVDCLQLFVLAVIAGKGAL